MYDTASSKIITPKILVVTLFVQLYITPVIDTVLKFDVLGCQNGLGLYNPSGFLPAEL
jgi:hypothetical protein